MKHTEQTIADLEARLAELQTESHKIKTAINCLCDVLGQPPRYEEVIEKSPKTNGIRSDAYYGRPLATVVTEVLEKRKALQLGAATIDDIYDELASGGYKFKGKNEGIKKRGLSISMSKNPKFHKLPNDTWGLTEWYPNIREAKGLQTKEENLVPETTSTSESEDIENDIPF
jgi:hypothetical protein